MRMPFGHRLCRKQRTEKVGQGFSPALIGGENLSAIGFASGDCQAGAQALAADPRQIL